MQGLRPTPVGVRLRVALVRAAPAGVGGGALSSEWHIDALEAAELGAAPTTAAPEVASVSRMFVSKGTSAGEVLSHRVVLPVGVSLAGASAIVAGVGAWRYVTRRRARECSVCRGYTIQQCALCAGAGAVYWEGKWGHVEPCPGCLGRRHVRCEACAARVGKPLFAHVRRDRKDVLRDIQETVVAPDVETVREGAGVRPKTPDELDAAKQDYTLD